MKPTTVALEVHVPAELHQRTAQLAIDLEREPDDVVSEALLLMLRYHEYGYGLVPPEAPGRVTT